MSNTPISTIVDYAQALVQPLKVLIADADCSSFEKITNALAPYDVDIYRTTKPTDALECLRNDKTFDLVFVGVPFEPIEATEMLLDEIQRDSPDVSVVIMAKSPMDAHVVRLMEHGPFTFLKKNGSFDSMHVQRIASQLNLKLRPSGSLKH